jgi:tetratricopeptide (TPR) repeat protein
LETGLDLEEQDLDQELPEWLQSLDVEPEPDAEEAAEDLDAEKAPEWLSEATEEPVSTVTVDQMPDWLGRVQDAEPEPAGEPGPVELEPEPTKEAEPLEWLQELTSTPKETAPEPSPEPAVELAEPKPLGIVESPAPEIPLDQELEPVSELELAPDLEPVLAEGPAEPKSTAPLAQEPAPLEASTLDASVQQYESLLAGGDVQEGLIAELEEAVQAHPEHAGLQRVLGDAYMRTNKLEQALEAYRKALSKL